MQAGSFHIRLCGPPAFCGVGASQRRLRHKAIALVAYLAAEARPIGRDTLSTLLWPSSGQSVARANLRTALHDAARRLPGRAIITNGGTLELDSRVVSVDVWFLREVATARQEGPASMEILARASELCSGEFLEGFTLRDCRQFDSWQLATAESIRQQLAGVLTRLVMMRLEAGDHEQAVGPALRLVALDPLEESSHRLAIEVYARSGKWAAAAAQFERCRAILSQELGAEPAEETARLIEEVRARSLRFGVQHAPSPGFRSYQRLPVPSNRFFGRSEELGEVRELIGSGERLVTVTGPAGIGKTRLAIEAVHGLDKGSLEGAVFVDLTATGTARDVPGLVAQAIGLQQRFDTDAGLIAALANQLDRRRVLLLLDNFEHVISASAAIAELLLGTETFQVLVTSREPLHVRGERQILLAPLGISPQGSFQDVAGSPAAQLFEDRARARLLNFAISPENCEAVRAICMAVDGVPLALELAVPLLQLYAPEELPLRLAEPLRYLTHGDRDVPERHRTLERAIAWSYDLLSSQEQKLLLELSVFANSFDLRAVESVCHAEVFHSLLDKCLVQPVEWTLARRFGLLQATREFAMQRRAGLSGLKEAMRRQAKYYFDLALRAEGELHGPDQVTWINRLAADQANILIALSFLTDHGRAEAAMQMAVALSWFWYRQGHFSLARQWLGGLLERSDDSPSALRAQALHALGWFTFVTGDWRAARRLYAKSLRVSRQAGDRSAEACALSDLGVVQRWLGNEANGNARAEAAVEVARATGSPPVLTRALIWAYATTGGVFRDCYPEPELLEACRLAIETGDHWLLAHSYNGLGDLYCEHRKYTEARSNYEAALQGFAELGDRFLEAWTLEGLGRLETGTGDQAAALRQTVKALRLFDELGDELNVGMMLARVAGILLGLDRDPGCAEIAGAAAAMIGRHRRQDLRRAPQVDEAFRQISDFEARFAPEWARGQSLSRADAVNLACLRAERIGERRERKSQP